MRDKLQKHIVIDARIRRDSGAGRYVDRLLEHLQLIDKETLYTILLKPDDAWEPQAENFQRARANYKQFSFNPFEQLGFAYKLYRLKPDLVHFTMTQQPILYFGNIVTTTHDLTMLRFTRPTGTWRPIFWLKKLGYRFLFWQAHKKSQKIIVPTQFVGEDLAQYQPFTKGKIVITHEASDPLIKEEPATVEEVSKPFILHVGSPFPHKNIYRLIEAFELLLEKHSDLILVLAGKKEFYFEELEEWMQQRPSYKSIRFTGFVPDNQLKWLYENAEAYILPSLSEGFGLPGLEAMVYGCPLVSSNATCLPEVYGNAAHYFDPLDINGMARAIEEVLESKELQAKLTKDGYEQLKKYSWQKMASQTLETYTEILPKNN